MNDAKQFSSQMSVAFANLTVGEGRAVMGASVPCSSSTEGGESGVAIELLFLDSGLTLFLDFINKEAAVSGAVLPAFVVTSPSTKE
jgi:hypothetical protein